MEYVKWLEHIGKDDIPIAGGKGANLGEMVSLRMPVPEGFVVTTKAFDRLMQINDLGNRIQQEISGCNVDDTKNLMETSARVKQMIVDQPVPDLVKSEVVESYRNLSASGQIMDKRLVSLISAGRETLSVAVRSSATAEDLPTASFAGQQATFLNVRGSKELVTAVKQCWASLFEPRAIFYRAKNGVTKASIAVVVQRMVNSEKSGVMFTVDPSTGEEVTVIEATWGLGELLVLGEVTPDLYRVSKDGEILEKRIGRKAKMKTRDSYLGVVADVPVKPGMVDAQVLTDDEIKRLAYFGQVLESHYGHPQDVEFAIERNLIKIVQTRAVTTQGKKSETSVSGNQLLKGVGASPGLASGKVKIVRSLEDITKVVEGDILVTVMTSPDLVPTMSKAAAIVTDLGGATSHAAIVSREMGIPAIVGTQDATKVLQDEQMVTVDAYNGVVYEGRTEIAREEEKPAVEMPAGSTRTKVKVNLVFAERLEEISQKADGVGLLRLEHMVAKSGIHPAKLVKEGRGEDYTKIILDGVAPIAKAFNPKPVWVRALDARSDEFRNLKGGDEEPTESNPMLGWHGIRRSLDEPGLLKAEFDAVKRMHESGLTNVHVILPFIISVDELRKARQVANEVGLPSTAKIGIMVETPAAAEIIEDFCKEDVGFVTCGTNDLTMLTLGVDRNNERITKLYSEFHPGVLSMLKKVVETCGSYGIESSVCGESGSNPEMARILVGYGISSVSCNMDALDKIRNAVAETEKG
jgi:pyruvate,water dikinase